MRVRVDIEWLSGDYRLSFLPLDCSLIEILLVQRSSMMSYSRLQIVTRLIA